MKKPNQKSKKSRKEPMTELVTRYFLQRYQTLPPAWIYVMSEFTVKKETSLKKTRKSRKKRESERETSKTSRSLKKPRGSLQR